MGRNEMGKKYTIGNKTYIQKPLVWGQIKQIIPLFQSFTVLEQINYASIAGILGDNLSKFLAIVLTEEGQEIRKKNLDEVISAIEYEITAEQVVQVVEDFFVCNPAASLLERLTGIMAGMKMPTGSNRQSSPLQAETL
ncbi:hypothetical protein BIY37_04800 [Candidatus Brocadia sapporoensis]|uniref:Uncharacterized protein n=2 Tax=Candidatus Brocadia sapporoensis TaxID=392547 RepID=A0A1V6M167_9BACT|nr:hypothetical protein [Candidatus Brocadia sp.]OQD46143.1 hypothetical protein BIY37_04800 [Candidatus Brocadia sapporoensis]